MVAVHYHQDTYSVTTADGRSTDFLGGQSSLSRSDSNHAPVPLSGKPVILLTGMMGDRASVFFASPAEMSSLIKHQG